MKGLGETCKVCLVKFENIDREAEDISAIRREMREYGVETRDSVSRVRVKCDGWRVPPKS